MFGKKPSAPVPARTKGRTIGPMSAVPCPWCGKNNDFSDLQEQYPLEKGCRVDCDHCDRQSKIAAVDNRPRLILEQYSGG